MDYINFLNMKNGLEEAATLLRMIKTGVDLLVCVHGAGLTVTLRSGDTASVVAAIDAYYRSLFDALCKQGYTGDLSEVVLD